MEHQIANGARFSVYDNSDVESEFLCSCDGPEDIKVEGLIVGGTTGEGHLLSWDEHLNLIAHTKDFLITSALLRFLQDAQQAKFGGRILIAGGSCKDSPILERSLKRRRRLVTADLRLQRSEILAATTLQRHLPVFSCCWLSLVSHGSPLSGSEAVWATEKGFATRLSSLEGHPLISCAPVLLAGCWDGRLASDQSLLRSDAKSPHISSFEHRCMLTVPGKTSDSGIVRCLLRLLAKPAM